VIAVHENTPVNLYWRTGRSVHHRLIAPGQIIVSPADYSNRRAWNERTEDVLVWLTPDSPYLGASTFALRPQIGGHDPLLAQLLRYLARTFDTGVGADSLYADTLAHALGAHLVVHYNHDSPVRPPPVPNTLSWRQLERVYEYIECNLHQALSVAELASIAGVSPTHLTRLFGQQTGEPPHRYVRQQRLERAERLIVGTRLPLAAIAAAVGFSDQSHLNRVRRAQRGVTPGQLRDSLT